MTRREGAPPANIEALTILGAGAVGFWGGLGIGAIKDQPHVDAQAHMGELQDSADSLGKVLVVAKQSSDPQAKATYSFLSREFEKTQTKITAAKQDMPDALGLGDYVLTTGGGALVTSLVAVGILRAGYRVRNRLSRHRTPKESSNDEVITGQ